MSAGITPYDFVQQVYYMQEKTILDFWPGDDKYNEVLMEANFVIQELQKEEDWEWLRESAHIGFTDHPNAIMRFDSARYYKPCTLYGDQIELIGTRSRDPFCPIENDTILVPFVSGGSRTHRKLAERSYLLDTNVRDRELGAMLRGDKIVFDRKLMPFEMGRAVRCDMQRRMELFDLDRGNTGENLTKEQRTIEQRKNWQYHHQHRMFTDVPDPNYIITRTACLHAEGSPAAQGRIAGLTDQAQKLLSAMRENNSVATAPDYLDWNYNSYVDVI